MSTTRSIPIESDFYQVYDHNGATLCESFNLSIFQTTARYLALSNIGGARQRSFCTGGRPLLSSLYTGGRPPLPSFCGVDREENCQLSTAKLLCCRLIQICLFSLPTLRVLAKYVCVLQLTRVSDLDSKWVRLATIETNPGLFKIRFQKMH